MIDEPGMMSWNWFVSVFVHRRRSVSFGQESFSPSAFAITLALSARISAYSDLRFLRLFLAMEVYVPR